MLMFFHKIAFISRNNKVERSIRAKASACALFGLVFLFLFKAPLVENKARAQQNKNAKNERKHVRRPYKKKHTHPHKSTKKNGKNE